MAANVLITPCLTGRIRSEEHTSELQSLMRISYAVFCLKKKKTCTISLTHENNNVRPRYSSRTILSIRYYNAIVYQLSEQTRKLKQITCTPLELTEKQQT